MFIPAAVPDIDSGATCKSKAISPTVRTQSGLKAACDIADTRTHESIRCIQGTTLSWQPCTRPTASCKSMCRPLPALHAYHLLTSGSPVQLGWSCHAAVCKAYKLKRSIDSDDGSAVRAPNQRAWNQEVRQFTVKRLSFLQLRRNV